MVFGAVMFWLLRFYETIIRDNFQVLVNFAKLVNYLENSNTFIKTPTKKTGVVLDRRFCRHSPVKDITML